MTNGPGTARNYAFLIGLLICSLTVAGLGIFGWFSAKTSLPLIICAAAFCFAAQIVAACCGANFGRHTWKAAGWTRALLICGYLAAAAFATYSADQGWMVATSGPRMAEVAARNDERTHIQNEIRDREGYVRTAEEQRAAVSASGPLLTATLQAPFTETIQRNERRLDALRADLDAKPALSDDRERNLLDWAALIAFAVWQALEPWLYHAVERGRRPTATAPSFERQPLRVVEGGRRDTPAPTAPSRTASFIAAALGLLAAVTSNHSASRTPQTTPEDRLRMLANQLSASMGERRIASRLTAETGQLVTRHQVRLLLGRQQSAA